MAIANTTNNDLTGLRFGRLVVVSKATPAKSGNIRWLCQCDCGSGLITTGSSLRNGRTKSCGCLNRENVSRLKLTHGLHATPEYAAWTAIIRRCENRQSRDFPYYGGRGILVCDRWRRSFESFLADMGKRPSVKHSIDRFPNQDGNYEPSNCRWATSTQQNRNRRNNCRLTFNGETLCLTEWAERLGVTYSTLYDRLRAGWPAEKILSPVVRRRNSRTH